MPILRKIPLYSALGVANAACFGLSFLINEEDYVYYFGYKGQGRLSDLARSLVGSNHAGNAVWTVPSLILGGIYMQRRVGYMVMAKFTAMSLVGTTAFMTAFNPSSDYTFVPNFRIITSKDIGLRWDSSGYHPKYGSYVMGADSLAGSILYFMCFYNKYWTLGLGFFAFDFCYYGPMFMGGPLSALIGAMTLL